MTRIMLFVFLSFVFIGTASAVKYPAISVGSPYGEERARLARHYEIDDASNEAAAFVDGEIGVMLRHKLDSDQRSPTSLHYSITIVRERIKSVTLDFHVRNFRVIGCDKQIEWRKCSVADSETPAIALYDLEPENVRTILLAVSAHLKRLSTLKDSQVDDLIQGIHRIDAPKRISKNDDGFDVVYVDQREDAVVRTIKLTWNARGTLTVNRISSRDIGPE